MRIVVGVDGSAASADALAWALEEGSLRGAGVTVVLAYNHLDQPHFDGQQGFDPDATREDAERSLTQLVHRMVEATGCDDVDVDPQVVVDLPARALLAAAEEADLLVVGSRGRGGVAGLLLGSVSQLRPSMPTQPRAVLSTP